MREGKMTLGAVMFDQYELLDFYGPLQLFGGMRNELEIITLAEREGAVTASSASQVQGYADCSFKDCPKLDIILVPGGFGTRAMAKDEGFLHWLRTKAEETEIVASVCTGALLLACAGLLDGRRATTNKLCWAEITGYAPRVNWMRQARWVDDGKFVTASGVSAGMDMALALIERIWGAERREQIRIGAEYDWHSDPNWDPFAKVHGLV